MNLVKPFFFVYAPILYATKGVILEDLLQNVNFSPTLLRVVRVFRIGRVLRLIKAAKGIRKLIKGEVGITEDDFEMFYTVWERYDPLATQFIKFEQLSHFVADLEPPLCIPKPNEIALVSFDLPIVEGDKLHCLDVLMALVKYVLGSVDETPEFKELHQQMEVRFQDAFPTRVNTNRKTTTMMRKKEDVAAKTLQRAWRSWKTQKQMKNIASLAIQQQNQKKTGQTKEARGKASSIRNLSVRLSTALTGFFGSSRPSSAISRVSVTSINEKKQQSKPKSDNNSKRAKARDALEMPKVSVLYSPEKDADIVL
ncbi:sodium channel protein 60E-like [Ruditapes philippinarum]|uniref:sodium channel protein 60E-like n=1 Tax=Ruditapes philippinarum TaxID=129788 RepID=UPI00295C39B9|nr:sodium channel protein 60E-like [Ruditapes philippinarum]